MDRELFRRDPRSFALELVDNGMSAQHLLEACLSYMSKDEVQDMLDANELAPRFWDDEDEDCDDDSYDEFDDDRQPDEAQEWYDFDPEC